MIFVDTSAWFAAHVAEDPGHEAARELILSAPTDLVTTAYVVDELLTLLVMRRRREIAVRIGGDFWASRVCELVWTKSEDVEAAWNVFTTFGDKQWSFTACVSYAVMKRLGIASAFAFDEHFKQFGFAVVKP